MYTNDFSEKKNHWSPALYFPRTFVLAHAFPWPLTKFPAQKKVDGRKSFSSVHKAQGKCKKGGINYTSPIARSPPKYERVGLGFKWGSSLHPDVGSLHMHMVDPGDHGQSSYLENHE